MAFLGCVVIDHDNTGDFAPPDAADPAFVAFFTGFDPVTKIPSQHLALSLDRGRTYTSYMGNLVIDIGSTEFRDPKVFWHADTRRSVMVVSVNHGSLWGGSGVQYFIGDFDGTHFIADVTDCIDALSAPPGDLIADFYGSNWAEGWHTDGMAFGRSPVPGALPDQPFIRGHLARGLANSGHGGVASTGTLTSPTFTVTRPCLSFLIGGSSGDLTRLEWVVDGQVVRRACGDGSTVLKWAGAPGSGDCRAG